MNLPHFYVRTLNLEAEHLIHALGEGVCWTKARDNNKHIKYTVYERGVKVMLA